MAVIGYQGPGIHMKLPRTGQGAETGYEVVTIRVIAKYGLPHDSTGHDMMEDAWSIQAGTTSHNKTSNDKP